MTLISLAIAAAVIGTLIWTTRAKWPPHATLFACAALYTLVAVALIGTPKVQSWLWSGTTSNGIAYIPYFAGVTRGRLAIGLAILFVILGGLALLAHRRCRPFAPRLHIGSVWAMMLCIVTPDIILAALPDTTRHMDRIAAFNAVWTYGPRLAGMAALVCAVLPISALLLRRNTAKS